MVIHTCKNKISYQRHKKQNYAGRTCFNMSAAQVSEKSGMFTPNERNTVVPTWWTCKENGWVSLAPRYERHVYLLLCVKILHNRFVVHCCFSFSQFSIRRKKKEVQLKGQSHARSSTASLFLWDHNLSSSGHSETLPAFFMLCELEFDYKHNWWPNLCSDYYLSLFHLRAFIGFVLKKVHFFQILN